MRAQEEMKLRREDARKLKRLQEENLPAYLKQLEEKNKLDTLRKKQKLNLPTPALQEHELVCTQRRCTYTIRHLSQNRFLVYVYLYR